MSRNVELRGIFRGERHVFENGPDSRTVIGDVDIKGTEASTVTVKGDAEDGTLHRGVEYRFFGQWRDHPRHGRQFWFVSFIAEEPSDEAGLIAYLQQCDGIGPATARAIAKAYDDDCLRMLREEPEFVVENLPKNCRLSLEKAKAAGQKLSSMRATERTKIDLLGLLDGRGFPKKTIDRAISKWKLHAVRVIRRNPYILMALPGCGFLKTDKFYLDLGLPPEKLKRQALCAWHATAKNADGSTWIPRGQVEGAVRAAIAGTKARPGRAIELAVRSGMLAVREYNGRQWVAEQRKAENEESVAVAVRDAVKESGCEWPDAAKLEGISDHQREEIAKATAGRIGVLRGSPGTGKTHSAAALIKAILPVHGRDAVAVAAPTGKAAVRLTEALDLAGVSLPVSTIHRALGVQSASDGGWLFRYRESEPLPQRFLIIDESSMIDTDLMASFLRARAANTHVLFVGDPYQLPPVGHGRPFLDLMTGGVPTGELIEIRRNSGKIVEACASIRDRRTFEASPEIDIEAGENLGLMERNNPQAQLDALDQVMEHFLEQRQITEGRPIDPTWDVQVLVAVNKRSELNRVDLNKRLQQILNSQGERLSGHPFRQGDKAVCLKNGWYEERAAGGLATKDDGVVRNLEGKVFVANGELAEVAAIEPGKSVMRLSSPDRLVVVPHMRAAVISGSSGENGVAKSSGSGAVLRMSNRDDEEDESTSGSGGSGAGDWDLGYALSVHKSQGSDWPVVLVMIDDSGAGKRVSTRNWLYTGISRAKTMCLLIGRQLVAKDFCTRDGIAFRKTFLAELLRGEDVLTPVVCEKKEAATEDAPEEQHEEPPFVCLTVDELDELFAAV